MTDGAYFDGTGFAEIVFNKDNVLRFEQEFRLISQQGIILLLKHQVKKNNILSFLSLLAVHQCLPWCLRYTECFCMCFLHQMQFFCMAALQGEIHAFYNFNGTLVDMTSKVTKDLLKITDGNSKMVSLTFFTL